MTTTAINLPARWRAHGAFGAPSSVLGILPHHGAHFLIAEASAPTLTAVLADLACGVAASVVDSPLASRPGQSRRSLAGFAGSRATFAPEGVALLSSKPLDFEPAVTAAALARGITRPLDVAWTRLTTGAVATEGDAHRRVRDLLEYFSSPLGLIVLVEDFAGSRQEDAERIRTILSLASIFPAPILCVTAKEPAEIDPDCVVIRLTEGDISAENPTTGVPFTAKIEREEISIDGSENAVITKLGSRRAYAPVRRQPAPPPVKASVGRPAASRSCERVFLVQTGRQLEDDERALFEDCKFTPDFLHAIKLAGQTTEDRAEIIIVPSNRDPRKEAASSVMQRVKSELLNAGLDNKVTVTISPDLQIAA